MQGQVRTFVTQEFVWALGSACALHRVPFDSQLLLKQFPPPYSESTLITAARSLGFRIKSVAVKPNRVAKLALPCLIVLKADKSQCPAGDAAANDDEALDGPASGSEDEPDASLAILTHAEDDRVVLFRNASNTSEVLTPAAFEAVFAGTAYLMRLAAKPVQDIDAAGESRVFGFRWFVPEIVKHKRVWRDVLLASLVLQLLALATPLFTQTIVDKVVVHHTESTLAAIAVGMAVFMLFTSLLTWVRQYLILHTGNRIDAVLGFAVFDHLFKLPPRYFQHRPTGVIAARLHGVETIREFIASAAVTLILDMPFLLICIAIMLWYSVTLTFVAIGILAVVMISSLVVAPIFQQRLNQQFLLGARNQAFLTEYISGFETVKSLQMEPQLKSRYSGYLATYLQAGFHTKQIGNTYNVFASTLEQAMTLLILVIGAYSVMTTPEFTIGMLVAFQMFAGKLSQPMMRMVGLWTQFQQASLSVKRLGDLMNAPVEPYSLQPQRLTEAKGHIEIDRIAFRYQDDLPLLYKDLSITVLPGRTVAIMGASGTGKSTLAKLLLGFYLPTEGTIRIDGVDLRHMAANELRAYFGVVPKRRFSSREPSTTTWRCPIRTPRLRRSSKSARWPRSMP